MTTAKFIWALERLAAIYRMPHIMFSDNANENHLIDVEKQWQNAVLEILDSEDIKVFASLKGITWKYITPRAPFQGGIWEAAVKSAKYHIRRIIDVHRFTCEQYQTLFAKISAVLNSRPLVRLSDDPTDVNYLTPSHALLGESVLQPVIADLSQVPLNRINQHKILDKIQQEFWVAWRRDYINSLQNQYRWRNKERNFAVGDFVILKEEQLPPGIWPIARVLQIFPGSDGMVRNVLIRTPHTDLYRAVQNLIRLPISDKDQTPIIEVKEAEAVAESINGPS